MIKRDDAPMTRHDGGSNKSSNFQPFFGRGFFEDDDEDEYEDDALLPNGLDCISSHFLQLLRALVVKPEPDGF